MTRFSTQALITQLQEDVRTIHQLTIQHFTPLSDASLLESPGPGQWSIAQCLDHLNSYGSYYLPLLEKAIQQEHATGSTPNAFFRSSWLGDFFVNAMRPRADGRIQFKAKAVAKHAPATQLQARAVLGEFLRQQTHLDTLLEHAKAVGLERLRIPISIVGWIKLGLGDTFRFLIAHEQRHVCQAQRVLKAVGTPPEPTTPSTTS